MLWNPSVCISLWQDTCHDSSTTLVNIICKILLHNSCNLCELLEILAILPVSISPPPSTHTHNCTISTLHKQKLFILCSLGKLLLFSDYCLAPSIYHRNLITWSSSLTSSLTSLMMVSTFPRKSSLA